jgi:hypothetical protein
MAAAQMNSRSPAKVLGSVRERRRSGSELGEMRGLGSRRDGAALKQRGFLFVRPDLGLGLMRP